MVQFAASALYAMCRLLAALPWALLRQLARVIAWLWLRLDAREARMTRRNLELARELPLTYAEREKLLRDVLRTTAAQTLETLRFWTRPAARNLASIDVVHGAPLLREAIAHGRGVIIAAPHFGNWELLNQWLAAQTPLAVLYRAPQSRIGEAFLRKVRANAGGNVTQIRAEAIGIRHLLRRLREGGVVGILPDQRPKSGDGAFALFFGMPAYSMTLLSRLAARSGAQVLFAWCERLPGPANAAPRFEVHLQAAPAAVADADSQVAVQALNAALEAIVLRDPAQYQWTYKRYTLQPPGSAVDNPYRDLERH